MKKDFLLSAPGKRLHVRISNRGIMEQFFHKSSFKKRSTKNTKGHYKNTLHKITTGHLLTPKKYKK
jgi:hypothetical protein